MKKPIKGSYGYLEAGRKQAILYTCVLFGIALTLYVIGWIINDSNRNIFTLFAILLCLPAGKAAVNMVMFLRAKGCSEAAHAAIAPHVADLANAYDLYLTGYSQNFPISHMAYRNHNLIAYTEVDSTPEQDFVKHLNQMLRNDEIKDITIHLFTKADAYIARLDQLTQMEENDAAFSARIIHVAESVSL